MTSSSNQAARLAYVFPGQGTQMVGMGLDVYQSFPEAREVFRQADEALDFPLSRLCFEGPAEELSRTINTQPAVLTVSVACFLAMHREGRDGMPLFVAGHSLGEYTALVIAKGLDFRDAVRLVRERGRLMEEAGRLHPGGMAAVMGLDEASLEEVCQETGAQIANVNSPEQIVISGGRETMAWAMDLARARGARRVVPLEVSGAFHSNLMQPAAEGMARIIDQYPVRDPLLPVVANTTARPLTTAEDIRGELVRQMCSCVQWRHSVEYMAHRGVSTFVEVGPGRVLTGLIKRTVAEARLLNIGDALSVKNMDA
ncbi:MAG: ACP S-malonyltransferase [Chloroflexi bacterium]|nr:ACP S-malonyltransferase [Chloroflexota bacterium]